MAMAAWLDCERERERARARHGRESERERVSERPASTFWHNSVGTRQCAWHQMAATSFGQSATTAVNSKPASSIRPTDRATLNPWISQTSSS